MERATTISGQDLRDMFAVATSWLEKSAADIDALNVFPVPDGDCGTNMLLTMRSSLEEAYRAADHDISAISQAMAKGALMGARGNSGVILSQIWRGIAETLQGKETANSQDLAAALVRGSEMAYKGLSNPVEGTMLTVMREASAAAQQLASDDSSDVISVLEATVDASRNSVANTPNLLSVLKEAGVVDAGGEGLYTLFDGALRYLKGEAEEMKLRKPQLVVVDIHAARFPQTEVEPEVPYGYCTEFLLKGKNLKPDKIRAEMDKKGQSVIVVGDVTAVRVHTHTLRPGTILNYAAPLGTMHDVNIRNMDEQHQDFLKMQKERMPTVDVATVAVVSGDGLAEVFRGLGVAGIVTGGQTMNPSTRDLLAAVEVAPSDKVIILPNNKNIVPTANQVQSLTKKRVMVVPSETIPQGVSALLGFDYNADFETNAELMTKAMSSVRSIEITRSVRSTRFGELSIKKGKAIGFLDGDLVAVGETPAEALREVLAKVDLNKAEVITVYYGVETGLSEAQEAGERIRQGHPRLQVEVVEGGQPHYNYLVAIE